ncbi:MAG: CheY-P-specific phosphatase CheC [Firmicutes bacterium]|nr:CheY-P-specific phosphatase CheC [Bacillota bacterium]
MYYNTKLDFLKELGNIGTGHATTALSQMLKGELLRIEVPNVQLLSFNEAVAFVGGLEQVVVGIFVVVSGDVKGHMAFILPLGSAKTLVELLTNESCQELDEMALSALQELGNIMITSYLNALAKLSNATLLPSVPGIAVDMAGAIWQSVLAGAEVVNMATLIRTEFFTMEKAIQGDIIFLPDEEDFQKLAHSLGLEEI